MATTAEHLAARADINLNERLMAAAEQGGVVDAQAWVTANLGALLTAQVATSQTIVDVYGSALVGYEAALAAVPPAPGKNPAAVTDEHLSAAIAAVLAQG